MKNSLKVLTAAITIAFLSPALASDRSERLTLCKQSAKALIGADRRVKLNRFQGRGDRIIELKVSNDKGFDKYRCEIEAGIAVIKTRDGQPLASMAANRP